MMHMTNLNISHPALTLQEQLWCSLQWAGLFTLVVVLKRVGSWKGYDETEEERRGRRRRKRKRRRMMSRMGRRIGRRGWIVGGEDGESEEESSSEESEWKGDDEGW